MIVYTKITINLNATDARKNISNLTLAVIMEIIIFEMWTIKST